MTQTSVQQLARLQTMAMFPYLIKVTYTNESGEQVVERYANTDEDLTYDEEVYSACYFNVQPPTRTSSSVSDGKIEFSTVDQTWIEKVRGAKGKIYCEFISCIKYDDNNDIVGFEEIDRIKFTLTKASWNEKVVSFTMMYDDRMNLCIPCDTANALKNPALV